MQKTFRVSKKAKIILSILLPILSCCLLSYQLFYFKCLWNCAPKRTFTTEEFVLPKSYFPGDAVFSKLVGIREDIQSIYSVNAVVYWDDSTALYEIRRLPTERVANNEYKKLSLSLGKLIGKKQELSSFSSSVANEYQVICIETSNNKTRCDFLARYEEFRILFSADVGPKDMTEDNYLGVLTHIDETMADLLMK